MKLDNKGYKALHDREGLRLKPYLCTRNVPTIALGNTFYVGGRKVTMQDLALTLLEAQTLGNTISDQFAKDVFKLIKSKVNQNQFNALVSLAYNIGIKGFRNSTVLRLVNINPNNASIASAFMMWTKNKELINRRRSEITQYFTK